MFGGCCEKTILHDIWLVEFWADLHKANFILYFKKILEKVLLKRAHV
jgi:hypothetical protein